MRESAPRQEGKSTFRQGRLRVVIGVAAGGVLTVLLAVPVVAEISRLTSIPLGRGTATISWTGKGGTSPTVNSISGKAGGLAVSATDKVPKIPGIGETPHGSDPTSVSIPSSLPIADVKGIIDGAPFTLDIVLTLPHPLSDSSKSSLGNVTGTFRNQKLTAILTANPNGNNFDFTGTIGTLHVSGVIESPSHHGNKATAHASFDVTR